MTEFKEYTRKWMGYVEPGENPTDEEWKLFFSHKNPVAGINRGSLKDIYTDKTGRHQVNERQTIKEKWPEIKKMFLELYGISNDNQTNDNQIKTKLKDIKESILKFITENGGKRRPEAAINRILVTLYPQRLLSIPSFDDVCKLAELLSIDTTNKDWIDLCFEIKPELDKRYSGMMHWDVYRKLVMENNLTKNYNLILTGAPGTGKTYMAKQIAVNIAKNNTKITIKNVVEEDFNNLKSLGYVDFVQFHPSYDYTDFVEGLRPSLDTNSFVRMDGVFKKFCAEAFQAQNKTETENNKYVFIIDEINRGEISKIFGELFFSIDPDYRGTKGIVNTQYQNLILSKIKDQKGKEIPNPDPFLPGFYVPSNVYIIGTMNDIDRSVESMDFAFRRRFTFYEITAEDSKSMLWDGVNSQVLEDVMDRINNELIKPEYGLSEAYQIGASYFNKIKKTTGKKDYDYKNELDDLWEYQIKGLLFEYLRGKPNASVLLKQLETAYKGKGKPDTENDEA